MLQPVIRTTSKMRYINMSALVKKLIKGNVRAVYKSEARKRDDIALYILCRLPNFSVECENNAQLNRR